MKCLAWGFRRRRKDYSSHPLSHPPHPSGEQITETRLRTNTTGVMRCIFQLQLRHSCRNCWNHNISCAMRYFYCSRTDAFTETRQESNVMQEKCYRHFTTHTAVAFNFAVSLVIKLWGKWPKMQHKNVDIYIPLTALPSHAKTPLAGACVSDIFFYVNLTL